MSSQPPSNGNEEFRDTEYGTSTETFYSDMTTLWLMDFDRLEREIEVASQGVFSCTLITSKVNPVFLTSCKVGTIYWPVTKDAPVIRIGQQRFMFAVPGLFSGLQLPQNCSEETLNEVVMFFRLHARYEDRRDIETGIVFPLGNEEEFWILSRQAMQQTLFDRLAEYGYHPPRPIIARARQCPNSARLGRLSTVIQTVNDAILLGSIKPEDIEVYNLLSNHHHGRAFPCISMLQNIVDAIELRKLLPDEEYASIAQENVMPAEYLNFAVWSLSKNKVYDLASMLCEFEEESLDLCRNIDFLMHQGNSSDEDDGDYDGSDDDYDGDDGDGDSLDDYFDGDDGDDYGSDDDNDGDDGDENDDVIDDNSDDSDDDDGGDIVIEM